MGLLVTNIGKIRGGGGRVVTFKRGGGVCDMIDTDKISDFHIALNNALPGIQFTLDKEKYSNLPFLDILIHRLPTGTLETSVYRKSTHSDVVLNFHSNSPASHKRSCVKAPPSSPLTHSISHTVLHLYAPPLPL